jgi:diguanylate cyclase (GGDEF)-like protein
MKILIAEDDAVSRRLLEATLTRWGYEVVTCCDGQEAWEALQQEDAPSLAILDWMMPRMDGLEVCRRVRKLESDIYRYLILLTAKSQKEDLIEGLGAGADDYVTKPLNRQEMRVRLRAGRRILELQDALIEASDRMKDKASRDPLTGLWNHEEIFRIIEAELERAGREESSLAVIMADLDRFKRVNDTYGHLAGDSVLRAVAERISASVRPYDFVARYGGEEYLVVVTDCGAEQAEELAERIREAIGSKPIDTPEGLLDITLSLGVATTEGMAAPDAEKLIGLADSALYKAKSGGRNRVELAPRGE